MTDDILELSTTSSHSIVIIYCIRENFKRANIKLAEWVLVVGRKHGEQWWSTLSPWNQIVKDTEKDGDSNVLETFSKLETKQLSFINCKAN